MDPFHRRLIEVGLVPADRFGFALAGGYAVQAHGFVERPSEDVDLFGGLEMDCPAAAAQVADAYRAAGLAVEVLLETDRYVRLWVVESGRSAAARWRSSRTCGSSHRSAWRSGLSCTPDDVAAGKIEALFNRALARDFIDVDALLVSGRYTRDRLVELAGRRDAGFDRLVLADMLAFVRRREDEEFTVYGVDPSVVTGIRRAVRRVGARATRRVVAPYFRGSDRQDFRCGLLSAQGNDATPDAAAARAAS